MGWIEAVVAVVVFHAAHHYSSGRVLTCVSNIPASSSFFRLDRRAEWECHFFGVWVRNQQLRLRVLYDEKPGRPAITEAVGLTSAIVK